jgi:N6-L-threonylcarbamoyladenine synthase/protein kinase Bud32
MTRVLGIEGTAWAASAAVFDSNSKRGREENCFIESDPYEPTSGGIHPREAAEHMRSAIPRVIATAVAHARETAPTDAERSVDAVAFSRGPGLGPCLRIVATAARALAQRLNVPLVGVNHMIAHLEVGRYHSALDDPVCLNASGANAHVLAYRNGRYRIVGETMDTGVGNALDKFTRHLDWAHPGGPKVEQSAREGEYVELPYVVKGMDFSFSGIMSAAKQAVDTGIPVADVCFSLQENIFAMLTEVVERALSLTGSNELVLGGGVGQNTRLREMLQTMCEERGASFFSPDSRFLRDNAGMIAILGAQMYDAGETVAIERSEVRPDFRPDEVSVSWRAARPPTPRQSETEIRGAEALVDITASRVTKHRRVKTYRHPTLDERLRTERTRAEARLTSEARRQGVPTPVVFDVDDVEASLQFETVGTSDLRERLDESGVRDVGRYLAVLHGEGLVHGDPTPRNVRVGGDGPRTYLIDFGLGYYSEDLEDYAMDLHVFAQSLAGTTDNADALQAAFETAYQDSGASQVVEQLREVEGRGRYQ